MSAKSRLPTLSRKETAILELLVDHKELYGLQLVSASKGELKRGTIYVTLGRMDDKGYVTSRLEDAPADSGGLPRRIYRATALGHRILNAWTLATRHFAAEFAR